MDSEKLLSLFFANHEDLLITGDFNIEVNQTCLKCFCDSYSIMNVTDELTFSRICKNLYHFHVSIWFLQAMKYLSQNSQQCPKLVCDRN